MIMSVSTLIMGKGAATAVRLVNFFMTTYPPVMVREGEPSTTLVGVPETVEVMGGLPSQTMTGVECDW